MGDVVNLDDGRVAAAPSLKSGNGGGTFDGMEARVAKLEADMEHIKSSVTLMQGDLRLLTDGVNGNGGLRERLTRLEERVGHLPDKGFIIRTVLFALTLIAALVLLQGNIQRFVGLPASTPVTTPTPIAPR